MVTLACTLKLESRVLFRERHLLPAIWTWFLSTLVAAAAISQEPQATIQIEVTAESAPVPDAEVTVNGHTIRTKDDGTVAVISPLGEVKISADGLAFARSGKCPRSGNARLLPVTGEPYPEALNTRRYDFRRQRAVANC
jgi:hypothetical protein